MRNISYEIMFWVSYFLKTLSAFKTLTTFELGRFQKNRTSNRIKTKKTYATFAAYVFLLKP